MVSRIFAFVLGLSLVCPGGWAADRPHILWITVEDMSPDLGCYGDERARTPRIDALARESVRFTRAFAAAPVCSPSRSCLITGMFPVTLGTHQMRSEFPLPGGVRGFPAYLRDAGYFTTNNVKTDYNCADAARLVAESWVESSPTAHWRDGRRAVEQPFFAVFNDMTTHQSRTMTWSHEAFQRHVQSRLAPEEIRDPATVRVPPYYPDTPVVRRTLARYADCISVMDGNVGRILDELEADGLAEDTIVFFFSDHGAGLPRHKRLLHDSGMHVPLLVRFPPKHQHFAPGPPGSTVDRLVSFVDFAPTVLRLAGVELPPQFQGTPFLGADPGNPPTYVYGSRDRVDEVFETMRSLRDGQYLYLRNYRPGQGYAASSAYSDTGEVQREIARMFREQPEALNRPQRDYAGPRKPAETFYDVLADPEQTDNLLDGELTGEQTAALERFRAEFRKKRAALQDTGCLTEDSMWRWVREEGAPLGDIVAGKTARRSDLDRIWAAANLVGSGDLAALREALGSEIPDMRFWAVTGLREAGFSDPNVLAPYLGDASAPVRFEVARWLAEDARFRAEALAVLTGGLEEPDWWNALHACRSLERLGELARPALPAMRAVYERTRKAEGDANLFLAFSSGAFLEALGEPVIPWDFSPDAGPFSTGR